jgi:hypothetical protein
MWFSGRHLDLLRMQGVVLHHLQHLRDDDAAVALRGLGDRDRLVEDALVLDRDVAVLVGGGAADQRHVDPRRAVEQPLLAVEVDALDDLLGGGRIELAALDARIDEGLQADLGDQPGAARRHLARQHHQDALRQVVGLDAALHDQLHQHRPAHAEVAADDALDHARLGEVEDAPVLAVAEPAGVPDGHVARVAGGLEALADGDRDLLGEARQTHAAAIQRGAVLDQLARLGSGNDFRFRHWSSSRLPTRQASSLPGGR